MRSLQLFVIALVVPTVGCDGHTAVEGRVVDSVGKPIAGVKVTLTEEPDLPGVGQSRNVATSEDGTFSLGITHAPSNNMPFRFELSKEGFVTHAERLTGTAKYEKKIVLKALK